MTHLIRGTFMAKPRRGSTSFSTMSAVKCDWRRPTINVNQVAILNLSLRKNSSRPPVTEAEEGGKFGLPFANTLLKQCAKLAGRPEQASSGFLDLAGWSDAH